MNLSDENYSPLKGLFLFIISRYLDLLLIRYSHLNHNLWNFYRMLLKQCTLKLAKSIHFPWNRDFINHRGGFYIYATPWKSASLLQTMQEKIFIIQEPLKHSRFLSLMNRYSNHFELNLSKKSQKTSTPVDELLITNYLLMAIQTKRRS